MKWYSLHAVNDLRFEELNYPECPSGWCIVKVKYSGICSSDISRIFVKGTYHFLTVSNYPKSWVFLNRTQSSR